METAHFLLSLFYLKLKGSFEVSRGTGDRSGTQIWAGHGLLIRTTPAVFGRPSEHEEPGLLFHWHTAWLDQTNFLICLRGLQCSLSFVRDLCYHTSPHDAVRRTFKGISPNQHTPMPIVMTTRCQSQLPRWCFGKLSQLIQLGIAPSCRGLWSYPGDLMPVVARHARFEWRIWVALHCSSFDSKKRIFVWLYRFFCNVNRFCLLGTVCQAVQTALVKHGCWAIVQHFHNRAKLWFFQRLYGILAENLCTLVEWWLHINYGGIDPSPSWSKSRPFLPVCEDLSQQAELGKGLTKANPVFPILEWCCVCVGSYRYIMVCRFIWHLTNLPRHTYDIP